MGKYAKNHSGKPTNGARRAQRVEFEKTLAAKVADHRHSEPLRSNEHAGHHVMVYRRKSDQAERCPVITITEVGIRIVGLDRVGTEYLVSQYTEFCGFMSHPDCDFPVESQIGAVRLNELRRGDQAVVVRHNENIVESIGSLSSYLEPLAHIPELYE